jgi:hypothetical protein
VAHAIRFHPQRELERGRRNILEVVRAIAVRRAVLVGRADQLERREELTGVVLRLLEHQVLEQVREATAPARLVLRADVVPDVDGDDRCLAIRVDDHAEAVRELELLERDRYRWRRDRGAGQQQDEECAYEHARTLHRFRPGRSIDVTLANAA